MTEHSHDFDDIGRAPGAGAFAAEAVRLMSSLQDLAQGWVERANHEQATPTASTGTTPGSDCHWCPLCQLIAVLRGDRPEITEAVTEVGTALFAALRTLVESAGAGMATTPRAAPRPAQAPRVQKIDLGDGA